MSKNNTNRIIYIIVLLLLVDIAMLSSYAWLSIFIRKEVGIVKTVAASALQRRMDAERLFSDKNFWEGSVEERAKIFDSIATPKRLADFFELAEVLAAESGVVAKISQAGFVKVGENVGVDVEVKAEGGFSGLVGYTTLLERMPYQYAIIKSQFISSEGLWSASYTLRISGYDQNEL